MEASEPCCFSEYRIMRQSGRGSSNNRPKQANGRPATPENQLKSTADAFWDLPRQVVLSA
jgi:hypothetical protein